MKSFREWLSENNKLDEGQKEIDIAIKKFIKSLELISEFEEIKKLEPSLINIIKAIKRENSDNYGNTIELLSKMYKDKILIITNNKIKNIISAK